MSSHTDLNAALNDVPVNDTERAHHALVPSRRRRKREQAGRAAPSPPVPPHWGPLSPQTGPPTQAPSERPRPAVVVSGCVPGAPPGTGLALDSLAFPVQHLGKNESQALSNFMVSTVWTAPFMFMAESSPGSVCRRDPPSRPGLTRLLWVNIYELLRA